ncbi:MULTISPECIES: aminoglycoside phosphotransferase family protein [unclassified Streptomyces]|uniref:phosphotransferase family protein n=1 Tax=unclassified Streptomyces TaxID=2593676 RepID=UPI00017FE82B|nr:MULTISPECIES: aminoglycoside phosphotransferase family protein [unclassified Streptomyces]EDY43071.1 aminoglycoside phosphotransferase [Streptomyces sp. SPB074]QHV86505.1 aminoglycoside phosphotransferase family protein [Streptomyces sp. 604F]
MTSSAAAPARHALKQACSAVGLDSAGAEPLRLAENQIWRLPHQGVIVRIAREGQSAAAAREVRVARWLDQENVPAIRLVDVEQPVEAGGRPVTFWAELPPQEHGSVEDVAQLLAQLHSLPTPDIELGYLDPFIRVDERLQAATTIRDDDKEWLRALHRDLAAAWAERPAGLPDRAVHGDAWPGNIVRTADGVLMMDLERFSVGPPEWDLVSTAVRAKTTGAVSSGEYDRFCAVYGHDVAAWEGYPILARARELRMVTYAAQHAASNAEWRSQAQFRIDCLRGRSGPRPWSWRGIL